MAQAAAGKTNWFAIWVSVAVVAVVAVVIALVAWMNSTATGPGTAPSSSGVNQTTGAITVGTGEKTLDTYVDFMCPICNTFEQTYGGEILDLVNAGTITLNIHPIAILDRASQGTQFSTRSASAMYCVADSDPSAAVPFMQAMFAKQPQENSPGLTDEQISDIAKSVGADSAASCITAGTYKKYVTSMTAKTPLAPGASSIGTPTIAVNGTVIDNKTIPAKGQFASLFK